MQSNQKFGLLAALLEVGAWTHAENCIAQLPTYYAVAQPAIAKALENLIHITMQPVHKRYIHTSNSGHWIILIEVGPPTKLAKKIFVSGTVVSIPESEPNDMKH